MIRLKKIKGRPGGILGYDRIDIQSLVMPVEAPAKYKNKDKTFRASGWMLATTEHGLDIIACDDLVVSLHDYQDMDSTIKMARGYKDKRIAERE